MTEALLTRIADALDRLVPPRAQSADWRAFPAYVWDGKAARGIDPLEAPSLDLMQGIDKQKSAVVENVARLSRGAAAHDMLLWGARGMGKSALLRAATLAAQAANPGSIALVQASPDAGLADLFAILRTVRSPFPRFPR